MSHAPGPQRRYRPALHLTPFELVPIIGDGVSTADLRSSARALRSGYVLEVIPDGQWLVVGWAPDVARAEAWADDRSPVGDSWLTIGSQTPEGLGGNDEGL